MRFGPIPLLPTHLPPPPPHTFSAFHYLVIHSERFCKPFHSKSTLKIVPKGLNEMVYDDFAEKKKKKRKKKRKKKKKKRKSHESKAYSFL